MIERIAFGSTGHHSTRVLFGAAALGGMRQERADAVLEQVLAAGVNHIDTAASYGDSELRLTQLMAQPDYARDFESLERACRERGVALQTIKSIARRRWRPEDADKHFSWYMPIKDPAAIRRAVHWVLARPGVFLNSSSDATLLPLILAAASQPVAW